MPPRSIVDPSFPDRLRQSRRGQDLSVRTLAQAAYVSKSTISDLENGKKNPSIELAAHLDRVLNAGGELAAMVSHVANAPARLAVPDLGEPGRAMDADDLAQLREAIPYLVGLDNTYGSDGIHRIATRAFRAASRKLAHGWFEPRIERDLHAAVGEMGELAGWLLYDADRQDEARLTTTEALAHSRVAGDRSMELFQLTNLAMQCVHLRRGREALRVVDSVLHSGRLSPRLSGLFHLRRARALAVLGDSGAAVSAMEQAGTLLACGAGATDPDWAWWIDEAELTWHRAMLHFDLGRRHEAIDLFQAAVAHYPAIKRRGHYNDLAHLADALSAVAAWTDVEAILTEILSYVDEIGSARTEGLLARVVTRVRRGTVTDSLSDMAQGFAHRLSI